jgi:hypothetical protein
MTIEKTTLFFQHVFNNSSFTFPKEEELRVDLLDEVTDLFQSTFNEQLLHDKDYEGGAIGVSQLGKPAIIVAWEYFNQVPSELKQPTFATKRKWTGGHMFELDVYYYLRRLGMKNIRYQSNVKVHELIPRGHPDFIVEGEDGVDFVVECKHQSPSVWKAALKKGFMTGAYLTQMHLYCEALDCEGVWLLGNTDTGEVLPLKYSREAREANKAITERAIQLVAVLNGCNSFEETLQCISPPRPLQTKDGSRYYLPPELYIKSGVLHPACQVYDYEFTDDGKVSVKGYNYPVEYKQLEPSL